MITDINIDYLDDEEKDFFENFDYDKAQSIPNLKEEIARYQKIAKDQYSKRKAISIRLLEYDIKKLKAKSKAEGIPYQTLIASAVHKYINS
ncbi:MAG: antitoxin [Candidatus Gracilibacteria bacterium]|nr:antitoxin [Candidatus Gracilibacteria bacterium]